jgi:DNA modification methylase
MIINGDCIEEMQKLIDQGVQVDAVVTDPPYHLQSIVDRFGKTSLSDDTKTSERARGRSDGYARMSAGGFMGQEWDGGDIAFRAETWRLAWELLKPGGHILSFSASRNYHRMAVAIEDAGFEIRDQMMWLYGSGFPKSHNIGKNVDKTLGNVGKVVGEKKLWGANASGGRGNQNKNDYQSTEIGAVKYEEIREVCNEWEGWGTALKPAHEPIAVGRKPISESTVAKNVLKHRTGAINIDASRIESVEGVEGRFPANIMHDGSDVVQDIFPKNKNTRHMSYKRSGGDFIDGIPNQEEKSWFVTEEGSAARYFYCPKVSKKERGENNKHPTVKPQELMKYLVRLVTPKGGTVLDPFMGSGSTGMAAKDLGFDFIGIEKSEEYFKICQERIDETNPLKEFLD